MVSGGVPYNQPARFQIVSYTFFICSPQSIVKAPSPMAGAMPKCRDCWLMYYTGFMVMFYEFPHFNHFFTPCGGTTRRLSLLEFILTHYSNSPLTSKSRTDCLYDNMVYTFGGMNSAKNSLSCMKVSSVGRASINTSIRR